MSHSSLEFDLNASSRATILVRDGLIKDANQLAQQSIPILKPGTPVPDELDVPQLETEASGSVVLGDILYECYCVPRPEGLLISLTPGPQTALNDVQLERIIMEKRQRTQDLLAKIGPYLDMENQTPLSNPDKSALKRYIHQEMRLAEFMDDLHQMNRNVNTTNQQAVNLASLCQSVIQEANLLLRGMKITIQLQIEDNCSMCMISADEAQLKRVLVELLANAIQAMKQRNPQKDETIQMELSRHTNPNTFSEKLCLTIVNPLEPSDFDQYTAPNAGTSLLFPSGETGAGMGLPIMENIVRNNHGVLLKYKGDTCFTVLLSFPKLRSGMFSVHSPDILHSNGISPVLVGLSEVLPDWAFDSVNMG